MATADHLKIAGRMPPPPAFRVDRLKSPWANRAGRAMSHPAATAGLIAGPSVVGGGVAGHYLSRGGAESTAPAGDAGTGDTKSLGSQLADFGARTWGGVRDTAANTYDWVAEKPWLRGGGIAAGLTGAGLLGYLLLRNRRRDDR